MFLQRKWLQEEWLQCVVRHHATLLEETARQRYCTVCTFMHYFFITKMCYKNIYCTPGVVLQSPPCFGSCQYTTWIYVHVLDQLEQKTLVYHIPASAVNYEKNFIFLPYNQRLELSFWRNCPYISPWALHELRLAINCIRGTPPVLLKGSHDSSMRS